MTSKSISITTDVYELLDKYRMKNESFSQAIKRLLQSKTNLMELAGSWKKIPEVDPAIEVIEEVVKKIHEDESEEIKLI
ncbi:MAG: antitoxin [Candidatus Lokiarchaeota archaeon]|nr:antitoxin [Candidatus Lokiarchaeota archaeon]